MCVLDNMVELVSKRTSEGKKKMYVLLKQTS